MQVFTNAEQWSGDGIQLAIGPHELRLSHADALNRLADFQTLYPSGAVENATIQGRPAVFFSGVTDVEQPDGTEVQILTVGLAVADDVLLLKFTASALASSDPSIACEMESVLASLHFDP